MFASRLPCSCLGSQTIYLGCVSLRVFPYLERLRSPRKERINCRLKSTGVSFEDESSCKAILEYPRASFLINSIND